MIYGFTARDNDLGGYSIKNALDGIRAWYIFAKTDATEVKVYANGNAVATEGASLPGGWYMAGMVMLPKGEHVIDVESACAIERVMIADTEIEADSEDGLTRAWENRAGQPTFEQDRVSYTGKDLKLLRRHGFVMHQLKDSQAMAAPSGMPLGGIGAGKVEVARTGQLTAFTGNNNQDSPVYRMPGSYFAIGVVGEELRAARLLQTEVVDQELLPAAGIEINEKYPFGEYKYNVNPLPVDVTMKAFSAHVPGDEKASSMPAVYFDFTIKSRDTVSPLKYALAFSWENLINVGGSMKFPSNSGRVLPLCYHTWNASYVWSDRRKNHAEAGENSIRFFADDDRGNPASFGEHMIWCSDKNALVIPDRSLEEDEFNFGRALATCFDGGFTPTDDGEFRAGALVSIKELQPCEEAHVSFVLCWYMPHMPVTAGDVGVYYKNFFGNVKEILDKALEVKEDVLTASACVNDMVNDSDLPEWFKTRLLNDRFVADTGTWFAADGTFSVNEAPTGMSGCLGTLDQRAASQGYWCTFFPKLDDMELELFRLSQAENGLCSHDIGFSEILTRPTVNTLWPDLAAAYVYQVYHHWQRTGDTEFINRHYPHVKKAVAWASTFDDADCGIPYIKRGRGTTYDNQHWEGVNSFIASVYMAMMFLAADMAKTLGDNDAAEYEKMAIRARDSRLELLWDNEKRYFKNAYVNKTGESDTSCFIASLAGDWYLQTAGIESGIPADILEDAARSILRECYGDHGMTDQAGRKNTPAFMQYPAAYYCAPTAYLGLADEAFAAMKTNDDIVLTAPSNHFIQGLTYWFDGGPRWALPYYMTAPATWNFLDSLSGLICDKRTGTLTVSPKIKGKIPVFTQDSWFTLEVEDDFIRFNPVKAQAKAEFTTVIVNGVKHEYRPGFNPGEQMLTIKL
ncbi:MAG: hypothetical protein E7335_00660 [Clostridiales bacterium]|nr:hypothetical protein [Clostridiales bacterium]